MTKPVEVITGTSRQNYTAEEKARYISDFENQNELSMAEFAKKHGISKATFANWVFKNKKNNTKTEENKTETFDTEAPANPAHFPSFPVTTTTQNIPDAKTLNEAQRTFLKNIKNENLELKQEVSRLTAEIFECHAFIGRQLMNKTKTAA